MKQVIEQIKKKLEMKNILYYFYLYFYRVFFLVVEKYGSLRLF